MNFFHLSPAINVVLPLKMDLEKIKRFANSEYEGWKIAKAVTEVKNEIKNVEQGRDVVMSDVFKTLREPLIEQQKKQMQNKMLLLIIEAKSTCFDWRLQRFN